MDRPQADTTSSSTSIPLGINALHATLDSLVDAILIKDESSRWVYVNKAACDFFATSSAELLGKTDRDIVDTRTADIIMEEDRQIFSTGESYVGERRLSFDGESRFLWRSKSLLTIKESKKRFLLVQLRDMTHVHQSQTRQQNSEKMEALGRLAGGIAHDFNNILVGILGNVQLARLQLQKNEDIARSLNGLEWAGRSGVSLTQQLLAFSRGGTQVRRIANIGELLRHTARFALSEFTLRCKFTAPDNLWPVNVDKCQISHAINSLLVTIANNTPKDATIAVFCRNLQIADPGNLPLQPGAYLCISILDSHNAVDSRFLNRVFDPQSSAEHKGLTLMSACTIIRKHEGHIEIDSDVGSNETRAVRIYLPALPDTEEELSPLSTDTLIEGEGRVLVMDDHPMFRRVAERMLQRLGYDPVVARNSADAESAFQQAIAQENPFRAVVLDLTVDEGAGGIELLKTLRNYDPTIPAILASGYTDDPAMTDFRAHGFQAAIGKPFIMETFSTALQNALTEAQ